MSRITALIICLVSGLIWVHPAFAVEVPLIGSYTSAQTLAAGNPINCESPARYRTVLVQGSGGAVNLTANPQITAGTSAGQRCTICGAHASNTVQLDDDEANGVDLSVDGSSIIFVDDPSVAQVCADFVWTGSVWRQLGGAATGADDQTASEVPFTPAGSVEASDVQNAIAEVASEGISYFSHATDCLANVTTAEAGDMCLDLDDGKFWRCEDPSGGASETLCDEADDWVGGTPIYLDANQVLTYLLSDGTKVIQFCNALDFDDPGTFCHRFSIDPTSGPSYEGVCGFSSGTPLPCDNTITVADGKVFSIEAEGGATGIMVDEDEIETWDMLERGSNPAAQPSVNGRWKLFFKSDGLYHADDAGSPVVRGPLISLDSAGTLTNKDYDVEGTGNDFTTYDEQWFDAAGCNNATAGHIWDVPTSNAPAATCDTESNTQKAYLAFDATTDEAIHFKFRAPTGFSSVDFVLRWKAAATSGATGWCVQLGRQPVSGTVNPALAAQASGNCVSDTADGTTLEENEATITTVTCTSCVAGDMIYGAISRDANGGAVTDSMTGDALLIGWMRRIRTVK